MNKRPLLLSFLLITASLAFAAENELILVGHPVRTKKPPRARYIALFLEFPVPVV